jgi:fermentation-respiration switch protein FrsA (DUF1100 family)
MGAYNWLVNEKGARPEEIIIFGRSLGGAIAAQLASEVESRGLVLESTFTSCGSVGSHFYPYLPVKLFCRYSYNTLSRMAKINVPVLVIHSPDDEMIPYKFGIKLFDAAKEPKKFVQIHGSHNDGFIDSGEKYTSAVDNWIKSL